MAKEYPSVAEFGPNKFPDVPLRVTDADFDKALKNYPVVVIDCWAPWCGPCRAISPIVDELATELKNKVVFGKLNTDENQETAIKYHIMAIPTLLIFKKGKLEDQIVGLMPKDQLMTKLKKHF